MRILWLKFDASFWNASQKFHRWISDSIIFKRCILPQGSVTMIFMMENGNIYIILSWDSHGMIVFPLIGSWTKWLEILLYADTIETVLYHVCYYSIKINNSVEIWEYGAQSESTLPRLSWLFSSIALLVAQNMNSAAAGALYPKSMVFFDFTHNIQL